ncbi:MAG: hypothetical protein ACYC65_07225 [Candidatus Limnocylindrales bacterium]
MALNVVQYEEIVALLRHVPRLVDGLETRSTNHVDDVLAWLRQAEQAMENNRLPVVSQVAACRATLIGSTRGVQDRDLVVIGRPTSRRIREATASMVLLRCNDLLHGVIAERHAVFQEAERIARQVIAIADAKGIIGACADGRPHHAFLACLQQQVAADPDLAAVNAHLLSLVGRTDVLVFLDRALPALS